LDPFVAIGILHILVLQFLWRFLPFLQWQKLMETILVLLIWEWVTRVFSQSLTASDIMPMLGVWTLEPPIT
jgi:hypothetical protein